MTRTPDRDLFMLYFEWGCSPVATLRGTLPQTMYRALWFNPRTGAWIDAGTLESDAWCQRRLLPPPSEEDWALKLLL